MALSPKNSRKHHLDVGYEALCLAAAYGLLESAPTPDGTDVQYRISRKFGMILINTYERRRFTRLGLVIRSINQFMRAPVEPREMALLTGAIDAYIAECEGNYTGRFPFEFRD